MTAKGDRPPAPGRTLHPTTCLLAARNLRHFGDGFVAVLLPAYLLTLGPVGALAAACGALAGAWPLLIWWGIEDRL